jgi:hypothetical protein
MSITVHRSPNILWRYNSIFNLRVAQCRFFFTCLFEFQVLYNHSYRQAFFWTLLRFSPIISSMLFVTIGSVIKESIHELPGRGRRTVHGSPTRRIDHCATPQPLVIYIIYAEYPNRTFYLWTYSNRSQIHNYSLTSWISWLRATWLSFPLPGLLLTVSCGGVIWLFFSFRLGFSLEWRDFDFSMVMIMLPLK